MPAERARGFSLIEMLVVLAILGLAAGMVVFHRAGIPPSLAAQAWAGEVATALRQARGAAIASNRTVQVTLVADGQQMLIAGRPGPTGRFPLHIRRDDGVQAISFQPDGGASAAQLEVDGGATRWIVDVDWRTGRVRVSRAN